MLTINTWNFINPRDPGDRIIDQFCSQKRKKMMNETIADRFLQVIPHHALKDVALSVLRRCFTDQTGDMVYTMLEIE